MSSISIVDYVSQEQNPMRKGLLQTILGSSVMFRLLRFVPVSGMAYPYAVQATLGGIAFRGLNDEYDPSKGTVNPGVEQLRIFGGLVQLDHQMRNTPSHTNAVSAKMKAAGLFYDLNVINGNPNVDAKAFWGLKYRLIGNQVIYAGDNGGALTLPLIDDLLDRVAGPNTKKVLLMSKYQRRKMKALLLASAGGASLADAAASPTVYDGAKIEVLDEDDVETPVLPQTETRGSSDVTGSIYCIRPGEDPEGDFVQGLVRNDMVTHTPMAQTNTKIGDLVEMIGGLGVFHGRAAARLAGLT